MSLENFNATVADYDHTRNRAIAVLTALPSTVEIEDRAKPHTLALPTVLVPVEPVSLDAAMLPALPVESLPAWFRDMALAVAEFTETPVRTRRHDGLGRPGDVLSKDIHRVPSARVCRAAEYLDCSGPRFRQS